MRLNLEVGESKTRSTRKSLILKNVNGHDVPVTPVLTLTYFNAFFVYIT